MSRAKNNFSPILDQFGNPFKQQATLYEGSLPRWVWNPRTIVNYTYHDVDFSKNVTDYDWRMLLDKGRQIYANIGGIKNAINEIADLSVGDGWAAKFNGEDSEWGRLIETWINDQWAPIADIRGNPWTLQKCLRLASISVDRDGDALCVLTETPGSTYPRISWIPAHRIGTRAETVMPSGPYKGYSCSNGVISNDLGGVIAYNIMGNDSNGKDDYQISIFDSQLVYAAEYLDQGRGLTSLASAIRDFDEWNQIREFQVRQVKAATDQALQMTVPAEYIPDEAGEYGDSPDSRNTLPISGSRGLQVEQLNGGTVQVWRPDAGAKLEVLTSHNPTAEQQEFMVKTLLRNGFLSLRWPIELCYDLDSKGATTKLIVAKAQRRIEQNQMQVLYPIWKRIISYAVAKAIKYKIVPKPKISNDWYKFEPMFPRSFSLDNYKDVKSDIEAYNRGWLTGTQIAANYGYDLESNLRQKSKELKLAQEIAKKDGTDPNVLLQTATQTINQQPGSEPALQEAA